MNKELEAKWNNEKERIKAQERFLSYIEKTSTCWNWVGEVTPNGYGRFNCFGTTVQAHRYSYEYSRGPIPEGKQIDHICFNRRCVNPAHLRPLSQHENILLSKSFSAKNAQKTHCPKGHPYEGANIYLRITKNGKGHQRRCVTCIRDARPNYQKAYLERMKQRAFEEGRHAERDEVLAVIKKLKADTWHQSTEAQDALSDIECFLSQDH